MAKVNRFSIEVGIGGYPVWLTLRYGDDWNNQIRFPHTELRDLEYAVKLAIRESRHELPAQYRKEV